MSIEVRSFDTDPVVVELSGRITGATTPDLRDRLRELVDEGRSLELDFSRAEGFSNLGLRRLLMFFRYGQMKGAALTAKDVPSQMMDAADAAGFLELFRSVPRSTTMSLPEQRRARIDVYPTHHIAGCALRAGKPWPLGVTEVMHGINFAVFSHSATSCTLVLFRSGSQEPFAEIPFPEEFRFGDVFAMTVFDLDPDDLQYGFRMDGEFAPERGHRFDSSRLLLDPMARLVSGRDVWGTESAGVTPDAPFRCGMIPADFDWEGDRPLQIPVEDLIIYEMHVRGFTQNANSAVRFPGTFAGLREKIGYLKELGVNCVELMPVFEFDELENSRRNPDTGERLYNYWGYSTIGFCAPKAGYAATGAEGMQADEFKALVKELHRNGIEIILDVVFNHTAEGNELGPTLSFRGIDNRVYYLLTEDGQYFNFSGCGNTVNCNHPVVRDFVRSCLRYWAAEYHIDGFRFDLASILGRDASGVPMPNPPLLESLAMDPVLRQTKLIAEAWDAGGLYQVGTFPAYGRWAEWNGRYRDSLRRFLKGDAGQAGEMAMRLLGSPDIYPRRGPTASINFVTCHDGFTLTDLVSYNDKRNHSNGEQNRDGANDNSSWNCGVEGPTDDREVNVLRQRQIRNALTMLFISHGIPMLLMGDECGRTKHGNNNTWCHDGPINWFDWSLPQQNAELFRFCRLLIRLRRRHPALRVHSHDDESTGAAGFRAVWHGTQLFAPDWTHSSRVLACELHHGNGGHPDVLYVAINMYWENLTFELPAPPADCVWKVCINTAALPPNDICDDGLEQEPVDQHNIDVAGRSVVLLSAVLKTAADHV